MEEFIESLEINEIRQNGFHFKLNPNSFPEYSVIKFQNFENVIYLIEFMWFYIHYKLELFFLQDFTLLS